MILHVKPPLTWLSHWRFSRKTGPLSWSRLRGRKKAAGRRARAALHARGGGPILEDEEIRSLRMRRRDGLPDQADRRHVNGGLTWRGDFREKGGSAVESTCRAPISRPSSSAASASCEKPGAPLLLLARSCGVERGSPYPSRACSLLAAYRAARSPSPARGRRPLATSRACSFPLAAVPLSRLASAVSIARNVQSTSRFLIVGPTQNAEAPAVGCGGRFGRKLSGESCLLVARLRWGRVQSACGGCSPSEWNRRARCGRFNLCGDAVARTDCLAPDSLTG